MVRVVITRDGEEFKFTCLASVLVFRLREYTQGHYSTLTVNVEYLGSFVRQGYLCGFV